MTKINFIKKIKDTYAPNDSNIQRMEFWEVEFKI